MLNLIPNKGKYTAIEINIVSKPLDKPEGLLKAIEKKNTCEVLRENSSSITMLFFTDYNSLIIAISFLT